MDSEMNKLPPLNAIRAFEAAARHQSFTRAAEELGMTQAAVSYQIKLLEDRLGTPLFVRMPRQVVLSGTGRRLAPAVAEAFEAMRSAFASLDPVADNVLSLTVLPTLASHWLVARIGRFHVAHPQLAVKLDTSLGIVDLHREDYDIGIRSGLGDWPSLEAHVLLPSKFTPVCSPGLLDGFDLRAPADLLKLPLIGTDDVWWPRWFAAAGLPDVHLTNRAANTFQTQQYEGIAAMAGQGVAMVNPFFFADEIASGRLVQMFDLVVPDDRSYWLVYPKARRALPKIIAFRDWALAEAGRDAEQESVNTIRGLVRV
jgi:LysR family transcriptional regulator, glycine cleavage system transcriptional activator